MFAYLVLYLRLPPQYVLREMSAYEAEILCKNYHYAIRDGWERLRQLMYGFGAKADSIKYDWDVESAGDGGSHSVPTDEELQEVADWAKQFNLNQ